MLLLTYNRFKTERFMLVLLNHNRRGYTHATSTCKVSKENCAEILGIKLKPSYSKSKFYNDVVWYKFICPTGRKLAYYSTMAAQRYNNRKVNNNKGLTSFLILPLEGLRS
jgi:hypothetical protein